MVINHNMSAKYANRQLGVTGLNINKDMEKLSSGERINRAGDDASGLAVSEKMRSQIRGLNRASQNARPLLRYDDKASDITRANHLQFHGRSKELLHKSAQRD